MTDPHDIRVAEMDALQLTQTARAQQWESAAGPDAIPASFFGPLAEALRVIDERLVTAFPNGALMVNTANTAGLAWAAAAIAGDQIATLTARVVELERALAELT